MMLIIMVVLLEFEVFVKKLIFFITEKSYECKKNAEQKNEMYINEQIRFNNMDVFLKKFKAPPFEQDEIFFEVIKLARLFLLDEIHKIKFKNNLSLNFEKIAGIFNKIEQIVGNLFFIESQKNENLYLKGMFNHKIKFDSNRCQNVLNEILNQSSFKSNYLADSFDLVRDIENKSTFGQYIHATTNCDTQSGQGRILFNVNGYNNQHIYIIDRLLSNNHNGNLLDSKSNATSIINLLPFISMITKITKSAAKKTLNEELTYFFRTPLIIVGDDCFKDFNKDMASFYSKKYFPTEYEWFFSNFFEKNEKDNIYKQVKNYLKKITMQIIELIKIPEIKNVLQANEKIILQQLYNTIKTIIFFEEKDNDIDYAYIEKTSEIINKISYYDYSFENLNLLNVKYFIHDDIYNNNNNDLVNIKQRMKNKFAHRVTIDTENILKYDLSSFITSLMASIGFNHKKVNEFIVKNENERLYNVLQTPKIRNILDKYFLNQPLSYEYDLMKLFAFYQIDFPDFLNYSKNIFFETSEAKEAYFLLFVSFFSKTETFAIKTILLDNIGRFFGHGFEYLENKDHLAFRFFLFGEFFFQSNLKLDDAKTFRVNKIIYKYTFPYLAHQILYDEPSILEKINQSIAENKIEENDNDLFHSIIETYYAYNFIPVEYARFIVENLGMAHVFYFIEYLNSIFDKSALKESLLWFTLHRDFSTNEHFFKF